MKKARARWFNVYEKPDGDRSRDKIEYGTRHQAEHQACINVRFRNRKLLYRIRVRRYLETET